jgi:hypothetical protein
MRTHGTPSTASITNKTNKTHPAGSFSSSWPGGPPCRPGVLCTYSVCCVVRVVIPFSPVISAVAGMCTAPAPRQDRQELPSSPILRRGEEGGWGGTSNFYMKYVAVSIRGALLVQYISEYCKAAACSGSSFEQLLDKK